MPLNYSDVASEMNSFYDILKTTYRSNSNPNRKLYPKDPKNKWVQEFMTKYDNDSINGTMSMASVKLVSMRELLEFSPPGCNKMGSAIARYWTAQVTHGVPSSCGGGIASVVNDADKIGPAINAYMCGLPGNIKSTPYYESLFRFIESQVKSIIWTVTETGTGGGPCTYSVTVS